MLYKNRPDPSHILRYALQKMKNKKLCHMIISIKALIPSNNGRNPNLDILNN